MGRRSPTAACPSRSREIATPAFEIRLQWSLADLLAYLGTWSATQRYIKAEGVDPDTRTGRAAGAGLGQWHARDRLADRHAAPAVSDEPAPYAGLTPDAVLDALESVGLRCDGRLLALNSYENRVYQVGIEDALPVVAKFYRPGRWSDAAILEEHALGRRAGRRPKFPPCRR